jgi:hypothetical protein
VRSCVSGQEREEERWDGGEVQPDEKESNFQTSIKERMWQRAPTTNMQEKKTVLSVQEPSLSNAYQC